MVPRPVQNGGAERPMDDDEQCPVCQSRKYLNRNLRFVISTECYHKMCESCKERILQRGPAPCPIVGCRATLRAHKFRTPTFADLKLEKEVDIRRMIKKTFNRREEDFQTLRDFNDYEEQVEDMIFNLTNGIDMAATYAKIEEYQKLHSRTIEQNRELEEEGARMFEAEQKAEKDAVRMKRQAARDEEERERQAQQAAEQEYLTKLAAGGDAAELAEERKDRLQEAARAKKLAIDALSTGDKSTTTFLKGLKKRGKDKNEPAFDPFGGYTDGKEYFVLYDDYPMDNTFNEFKKTPKLNAGGYDPRSYYKRALCDAFSGLGVFVQEDKAEEDEEVGNRATIAVEETAFG